MINIHTIEQRTQIESGKQPMTIVREVSVRNGRGRKTIRVLRGFKVLSQESEPLNFRECKRVHKRKFVKGLYKKVERRTLKKLN